MKQKTDWMWVIQMITLSALGGAIGYFGKITGMLWERVDYLQLEVEVMKEDRSSLTLPQNQTKGPSIFENLGINKNGKFEEK